MDGRMRERLETVKETRLICLRIWRKEMKEM